MKPSTLALQIDGQAMPVPVKVTGMAEPLNPPVAVSPMPLRFGLVTPPDVRML